MNAPGFIRDKGRPEPQLVIPLSDVYSIIDKLREYDSLNLLKESGDEWDEASNPLDGEDVDVLHDRENQYEFDPVLQELHAHIDELPEDQQIDLVALAWLGRDNYAADDWPAVREEAVRGHNARTAAYLLGSPLAADFLQEGLATLGFSSDPSTDESLQEST